jgi:hypothetical protein
MYCVGCGATLQAGQTFCGSCGKAAGGVPLMPIRSRLAGHMRLLAILWFAISAFRLIPGIAILTIFGNAGRPLPIDVPGDVPAFVIGLIQVVGYCFLGGAGIGFIAGWGLLSREPWARMLTIVLGAISLIDVPFGTALGIYTLWVLLPAQSEEEFRQLSTAA